VVLSCPQKRVNGILKERWMELSEDDKEFWRQLSEWDKKRYARDLAIYEKAKDDAVDTAHVPKKRKSSEVRDAKNIPKKRKG
jgi:uncharacterized protein YdaU (DUF1376 family)